MSAVTTTRPTGRLEVEPGGRAALDSPIGVLHLDATAEALTHVWLPGSLPVPGPLRQARRGSRAGSVLDEALAQLCQYFAGDRKEFDLPLSLGGTDFQQQVWLALADIPYGAVISYAELARAVGRPSAYRAVGQANGANPIPVVLPCHRVVASAGKLGGYGGGLAMKRSLLALEGVDAFAS